MRSNIPCIVIGVIALAVAAMVFYVTVLPWLVLNTGLLFLPSPPIPEIKQGEFPFRLEYEIDGNRVVVEDSLICEYDGVGVDAGQGKFRKWKGSLASGNSEILLLKIDDNRRIYYSPGGAKYYMGDMREGWTYDHQFPNASFIETKGNLKSDRIIFADELMEKYNIKLISWEYTEPIENTFISK